MSCIYCNSNRIMNINCKCNDSCSLNYKEHEYIGYVPGCNIGYGDYIDFAYCLDCGKIQNEFPFDECNLPWYNNEME